MRIGNFEEANNIIKVLEKRKLNNTAKALLLKNKATIAYNTNNKEEFYKQYKKFEKMSNPIMKKNKETILISLQLQKNILENNEDEINKICEYLINSKSLLNKVTANYYKGLILEKNNKEGYKEYYKFVIENGNNLNIAKIASEKLGIIPQIKYK